jgi:hypothetical protein
VGRWRRRISNHIRRTDRGGDLSRQVPLSLLFAMWKSQPWGYGHIPRILFIGTYRGKTDGQAHERSLMPRSFSNMLLPWLARRQARGSRGNCFCWASSWSFRRLHSRSDNTLGWANGNGYEGQKLLRGLCCINRFHGVKRSISPLAFTRPLSEFTNSFSRPDLQRITPASYASAALGTKNVGLQRKRKRRGLDAGYE